MAKPSPIPLPDESDDLERLRAMSDEDRASDLVGLMQAAAHLLAINDHRDRVLALRDPLPVSTEEHLARLRAQARRPRR